MWVTLRSAPILTASAFNCCSRFFRRTQSDTPRVFTFGLVGTPYFPVQIFLGAMLGWLLGRASSTAGDAFGLDFAVGIFVLRVRDDSNSDSCHYASGIPGGDRSIPSSALFRMGLSAGKSLYGPGGDHFAFLRHRCLFDCGVPCAIVNEWFASKNPCSAVDPNRKWRHFYCSYNL